MTDGHFESTGIRHRVPLVEKGFSPLLIAERLGHEKVQTTMDIYSHLYPNKQQAVARILNETIDPKSPDSAGYKKSEKM